MTAKFESFLRQYPLPAPWSAFEVYESTCRIGSLTAHMVGLSTTDSSQQSIFSAATECEEEGPLKDRAYFELLERVAIFEARMNLMPVIPLLNRQKNSIGHIDRQLVFPNDSSTGKWRWSLSNGVAASRSFEDACLRQHLSCGRETQC